MVGRKKQINLLQNELRQYQTLLQLLHNPFRKQNAVCNFLSGKLLNVQFAVKHILQYGVFIASQEWKTILKNICFLHTVSDKFITKQIDTCQTLLQKAHNNPFRIKNTVCNFLSGNLPNVLFFSQTFSPIWFYIFSEE